MSVTSVRKAFNRASITYDQHSDVQVDACNHLIEKLMKHKKQFNTICDLASGTGESTLRLLRKITYKQCYSADISINSLVKSRSKLNNISQLLVADFNQALFSSESLDLIFSNMGLQWSDDFNNTLKLCAGYLKNNGILAISIPVDDNFPELHLDYKLPLNSHLNIIKYLNQNQFETLTHTHKTYQKKFSNQIEILTYLKNIGVNGNSHAKKGLFTPRLNRIFLQAGEKNLTYKIGTYLARIRK